MACRCWRCPAAWGTTRSRSRPTPTDTCSPKLFEERYDFELAALSPEDGSALWTERYAGPDGAWDRPYSMAVSPDEEIVYVTGMRDYPQTPNVIGIGVCSVAFAPASAFDSTQGRHIWAYEP